MTNAQDDLRPLPLSVHFPSMGLSFRDTSLFRPVVDGFRFGHHWGAARLRLVNTALFCNLTNDHWSYFPAPSNIEQLRRLDRTRVNYLGWALGAWEWRSDQAGRAFAQPWIGMRYDPAERAGNDADWTPRDAVAWPYGFEVRHPAGRVPEDPDDENYRRYILDAARFPATVRTKVLDSAAPRTSLFDYHTYRGGTSGDGVRLEDREQGRPDSVDGRRLLLVIDLRRLDADDTRLDDTPILHVGIEARRFEPDAEHAHPVLLNFSHVPDPDGVLDPTVPHRRGRHVAMVPAATQNDGITIRRRHLPVGTDRDITIVAEFRTDTAMRYDSTAGVWKALPALRLKPTERLGHGREGSQQQYLDTITPVVWYEGSTSVAIRSISVMSPLTYGSLAGIYDSIYAAAVEAEIRTMRALQRYWHDSIIAGDPLGKPIYVAHIYPVDEYLECENLGVWYRGHLLDSLVNSETGFRGPVWDRVYRIGDARQKLQMMPTHATWTSGIETCTRITRSAMFPYADHTFEGDAEQRRSPEPWPSLNQKAGYLHDRRHPYWKPYYAAYETIGLTNLLLGTSWEPFGLPLPERFRGDRAYDVILANHAENGYPAVHEHGLHSLFGTTGRTFFERRKPWYAHFFTHLRLTYGTTDGSGSPLYVRMDSWRPMTGEELRLQLGASVAFGAKGLIYDKFYTPTDRGDGRPYIPSDAMIREAGTITNVLPGIVSNPYGIDWDSVDCPIDILFPSDSLGGDFLQDGDEARLSALHDRAAMAERMQLSRCYPSPPEDHIYLGYASMRDEIRRWHTFLMNADPSVHRMLFTMYPTAWIGAGYRRHVNGSAAGLRHLADLIDTGRRAVLVQTWPTEWPAHDDDTMNDEPADEHLYDIVLLDTATVSVTPRRHAILAVTNRRTAPAVIDPTMTDSIRVRPTLAFRRLVDAEPRWRYRQLGARRVTLRLRGDGTRAGRVIRVRELSVDPQVILDADLRGGDRLAVDLQPGATRFFSIEVQDSEVFLPGE